jgi:predicted membrane protein
LSVAADKGHNIVSGVCVSVCFGLGFSVRGAELSVAADKGYNIVSGVCVSVCFGLGSTV